MCSDGPAAFFGPSRIFGRAQEYPDVPDRNRTIGARDSGTMRAGSDSRPCAAARSICSPPHHIAIALKRPIGAADNLLGLSLRAGGPRWTAKVSRGGCEDRAGRRSSRPRGFHFAAHKTPIAVARRRGQTYSRLETKPSRARGKRVGSSCRAVWRRGDRGAAARSRPTNTPASVEARGREQEVAEW